MGGMRKSKSCFDVSAFAAEDEEEKLVPTALWLPPLCINEDDGTIVEDCEEEQLHLPTRTESMPCFPLDEYLSTIPKVASRSQLLLASCELDNNKENNFDSASSEHEETTITTHPSLQKATSCLNVLQGEVAHATASQADVIVSAEATTCHVIAMRSTMTRSIPLVSVAHIDEAGVYDSCLEDMLKEHIDHHHHHTSHLASPPTTAATTAQTMQHHMDDYGFFWEDERDDGDRVQKHSEDYEQHFLPSLQVGKNTDKNAMLSTTGTMLSPGPKAEEKERIEMELHIVGGYLDKNGTSQELSSSLIITFSKFAKKYKDTLRISLSTAAISCMNTTTTSSFQDSNGNDNCNEKMTTTPQTRGLGIDTRTGEVFPVRSIPDHLEGPGLEIRTARVLARPQNGKKKLLAVIHDGRSNGIRIEPFHYEPLENLNILLNVPDETLLKVTSTSPECESDKFCGIFRRSLSFVNTVPHEDVFGNGKPLVYTRSISNSNKWVEAPI